MADSLSSPTPLPVSFLLAALKQSLSDGKVNRRHKRPLRDLQRVYSLLIYGAPSYAGLAEAPVEPLELSREGEGRIGDEAAQRRHLMNKFTAVAFELRAERSFDEANATEALAEAAINQSYGLSWPDATPAVLEMLLALASETKKSVGGSDAARHPYLSERSSSAAAAAAAARTTATRTTALGPVAKALISHQTLGSSAAAPLLTIDKTPSYFDEVDPS